MAAAEQARRVKVWDPFIRVYHWALAALVIANWLLGHYGPAVMTLHFWLGYAIIALIAARIIWGFIGPEPARFASFLPHPRALAAYARGFFRRSPSLWHGHNPMGALSVLAILGLLLWQVGSGLIADPDDFINIGPLASEVSRPTSRSAVAWHKTGADIIMWLVILHVAVILYYRIWKNEDLIRPMITGWKWVRRR